MPPSVDWLEKILNEAQKWNHKIYGVTGVGKPTNKCFVLWSCQSHPSEGTNVFDQNESFLKEAAADKRYKFLSQEKIAELITQNYGQRFYASRIDCYLQPTPNRPRTACCFGSRKYMGFGVFKKLLEERSEHYNSEYVLLVKTKDYKGKFIKYPIRCKVHNVTSNYSMQDLNYNTSCPCPVCRRDPNHKNVAVEIIQRRNAGRAGQVARYATLVKNKYNNACALSGSTFQLHYHHLDGKDFYEETASNWESNGICLCSVIHRDYHNNFLKNTSMIAPLYTEYKMVPEETQDGNINDSSLETINPDFVVNGAEVSRYTFLEYLNYLIFDIKKNDSAYVTQLNTKLQNTFNKTNPSLGELSFITLEKLEQAKEKYVAEYKGDNWALANNDEILFANDKDLWAKVDTAWVS